MPTPHDELVKFVFQHPDNAAGLLRSLLPAALVARLDWSTLKLEDRTFMSDVRVELRSDLLFSLQLLDSKRPIYLYVLVEHQSTEDARMPLRFLVYLAAAYDKLTPAEGPLPVIIPLVISHAEDGWRQARSSRELFDLDPELEMLVGKYIPSFELLIDDLALTDESELRARPLSELAFLCLLLLKVVRSSQNLHAQLEAWFDAFEAVARAPNGLVATARLLDYVPKVGEIETQTLVGIARRIDPQVAEAVMTGAEKLRQEGRDEGRAEGRAEGQAQVLLKQLRLKFGALPAEVERRVRGAKIEQLDQFAERVLTAAELDDVFR